MSKESYKKWYDKNIEHARKMKRENMQKLRAENPNKYAAQSRKAKVREKLKLFEIYGNVCVDCGFSDMRALSLDHVLNNGNKERIALGVRGVYRQAKSKHQPEKYQILCMNCQFIKRALHADHIDLNKEWQQQHLICLASDSRAA